MEWWQHVGFVARPTKPRYHEQFSALVVALKTRPAETLLHPDLGTLTEGETVLYVDRTPRTD